MNISISTEWIVKELKRVSYLELQNIENIEARYNIAAGSEKESEIKLAVLAAHSQLVTVCSRFIVACHPCDVTVGTAVVLPTFLKYNLSQTDRRPSAEGTAIVGVIQQYLIHASLANFYSKVGASDLEGKHTGEAAGNAAVIQSLIYDKKPPQM